MHPRQEGHTAKPVVLIYCTSCGTALGAARPDHARRGGAPTTAEIPLKSRQICIRLSGICRRGPLISLARRCARDRLGELQFAHPKLICVLVRELARGDERVRAARLLRRSPVGPRHQCRMRRSRSTGRWHRNRTASRRWRSSPRNRASSIIRAIASLRLCANSFVNCGISPPPTSATPRRTRIRCSGREPSTRRSRLEPRRCRSPGSQMPS